MGYSPPGSSVHGILQARILEWVAMPSSRGSSPGIEPRSPALQVDSFLSEPSGKPIHIPMKNESRSVMPDSLRPLDYTVHGILQARILEWVTFPFSRGSSQPRDWTQVSRIAGGFFTSWATREATYLYTPQNMTRITPRPDLSPMTVRRGPRKPSSSPCFPSRWFSALPLTHCGHPSLC